MNGSNLMQSRLNVAAMSLASAETLRRAKDRAKLAFAAYEEALRTGDTDAAEAARTRFLEASSTLKGGAH